MGGLRLWGIFTLPERAVGDVAQQGGEMVAHGEIGLGDLAMSDPEKMGAQRFQAREQYADCECVPREGIACGVVLL